MQTKISNDLVEVQIHSHATTHARDEPEKIQKEGAWRRMRRTSRPTSMHPRVLFWMVGCWSKWKFIFRFGTTSLYAWFFWTSENEFVQCIHCSILGSSLSFLFLLCFALVICPSIHSFIHLLRNDWMDGWMSEWLDEWMDWLMYSRTSKTRFILLDHASIHPSVRNHVALNATILSKSIDYWFYSLQTQAKSYFKKKRNHRKTCRFRINDVAGKNQLFFHQNDSKIQNKHLSWSFWFTLCNKIQTTKTVQNSNSKQPQNTSISN